MKNCASRSTPNGCISSTTNRSRDFTRGTDRNAVEGRQRQQGGNHDPNPSTQALQLSAASALAAGTGGLAGILASGRAPAYAQTQTMHWLRWADFVPASDQLLKGEIVKLCEKDLGMKLTVETINANDIQARITAAIQSGAGPDIFMTVNNWPQLYADSCVDVSDVANELGRRRAASTISEGHRDRRRQVDRRALVHRRGLVATASPGSPSRRKGIPQDLGRIPRRRQEAEGRRPSYGQTAGHTFGDAPGWWYPYVWSWGGKEVEADGKTVVLNTKETVESVKFAVALWKETMDEGGLAWDDTNNNRAFLSGSISATNNGASIILRREKKPDSYLSVRPEDSPDHLSRLSAVDKSA